MNEKQLYIIGQMSGTSLDGMDLVYVKINSKPNYCFEILAAKTFPYSKKWINRLKNGFYAEEDELEILNIDYGNLIATTVLEFIALNNIEKVDLIASHGHTIFHNPKAGYTLQIGNGPQIFNKTKIKTICDFRVQDVQLGGQGAPLVPIGDRLLFNTYDYCLNLGGFANISFEENNKRIAFDICPVNIVMNFYAKSLGKPYDDKGAIARKGKVHQQLLNQLNAISFYQKQPPKSLGFEFVKAIVFPIIQQYPLPIPTILRTFIEHIAMQMATVIKGEGKKCLITGGGTFNEFLIEVLASKTNVKLELPAKEIINYKEALIFALLGYLKNFNKVNCLKSVTGASKDHSSGVIYS